MGNPRTDEELLAAVRREPEAFGGMIVDRHRSNDPVEITYR